jgi:hypothetical protein
MSNAVSQMANTLIKISTIFASIQIQSSSSQNPIGNRSWPEDFIAYMKAIIGMKFTKQCITDGLFEVKPIPQPTQARLIQKATSWSMVGVADERLFVPTTHWAESVDCQMVD